MTVFKCDAGELECTPIDMRAMRDAAAKWESDNPMPQPPLVARETFEAVMAGRGVDMLPNPDDETYKSQLSLWNWKRYQFTESLMIKSSVQLAEPGDYQTLALILIDGRDGGKRQQLYRFIRNISEVTQEAVDEAAKRFRLQMAQQAAARLAHKGRGRARTIRGNGVQGSGRDVQFTRVGSRQTYH